MKLTPSDGQDMMIWFRPENRSHALTVYYHFILPVPGMVLMINHIFLCEILKEQYNPEKI